MPMNARTKEYILDSHQADSAQQAKQNKQIPKRGALCERPPCDIFLV